MEVTDVKTISRDELLVSTNKYLQEIEQWDERDLPYYKRKVRGRIFGGYTSIITALIIISLANILVTVVGMMFFDGFFDSLSTNATTQWIVLGVFYFTVFLSYYLYAKKSTVKFIDSCHGEIAHEGSPFIKKVIFNLVFSFILGFGVSGYAIYTVINSGSTNFLPLLMYFPAIISPFSYFLGTLTARNDLSVCPVCGRYNTVFKRKISNDFGEKMDGEHIEHDYKSERVGTKTTTTYYTDGSTSEKKEGIYESVRYTNEYQDFSNLAKYIYQCKECSYVEETVEEKSWKVLKARYRG